MSDKELIRTLRKVHDADFTPGVYEHSIYGVAADRLEALERKCTAMEAVLDHLREATKMVPKWVSVEERLPEMHQSTYEDIDGMHKRYQSEPVLGVDICGEVAIVWHNRTDYGESYWEDEPGNIYEITHWMPFPEPPSTEGVTP